MGCSASKDVKVAPERLSDAASAPVSRQSSMREPKPRKRSSSTGQAYTSKGLDLLCTDDADGCMFCLLDAQAVRERRGSMKTTKKLPEFRMARAEGFLVNERLETKKALLGGYVGHILAVSHRWDDKLVPDHDGGQLTALCDYLNTDEGKGIKYVFYDYSCMPQGERDEEEERFFLKHLSQVNLLYLGCTVLVMLERSYMGRFWTMFEAWLSMQKPSKDGLVSAPEQERRVRIVMLHEASEKLKDALIDEWGSSDCTAIKAYDKLSKPDVQVTNTSDKWAQLPKIIELDAKFRDASSFDEATWAQYDEDCKQRRREEDIKGLLQSSQRTSGGGSSNSVGGPRQRRSSMGSLQLPSAAAQKWQRGASLTGLIGNLKVNNDSGRQRLPPGEPSLEASMHEGGDAIAQVSSSAGFGAMMASSFAPATTGERKKRRSFSTGNAVEDHP